jgi:hypothetical protein
MTLHRSEDLLDIFPVRRHAGATLSGVKGRVTDPRGERGERNRGPDRRRAARASHSERSGRAGAAGCQGPNFTYVRLLERVAPAKCRSVQDRHSEYADAANRFIIDHSAGRGGETLSPKAESHVHPHEGNVPARERAWRLRTFGPYGPDCTSRLTYYSRVTVWWSRYRASFNTEPTFQC